MEKAEEVIEPPAVLIAEVPYVKDETTSKNARVDKKEVKPAAASIGKRKAPEAPVPSPPPVTRR